MDYNRLPICRVSLSVSCQFVPPPNFDLILILYHMIIIIVKSNTGKSVPEENGFDEFPGVEKFSVLPGLL